MSFDLEDLMKLFNENPEMLSEIVKGLVERFKPAIYGVLNELMGFYRDYANNDEIFELDAKVKKKAFMAYVNAGFTEDQAMALLLRDNIRLNDALQNAAKSLSANVNVKH